MKRLELCDKIYIEDLSIHCIIGENDWERTSKQKVITNITMYLSLHWPGKTDQLTDTVDYKSLKKNIIEFVESSKCHLVEHLAEKVAEICLTVSVVQAVKVRIDKPGALRFARSVGVEVLRDRGGPVGAFIAVGSNINPYENIYQSFLMIKDYGKIAGISNFYRTKPLQGRDQNDYLNGVWKIQTSISPRYLKYQVLKRIETKLGRIEANDKYAPRQIDLDLILYGNDVTAETDLNLPAPEIYERNIIAVPLLEIDPNLTLPDTGLKLSSLQVAKTKDDMIMDHQLTELLKTKLAKVS